MRSIAMAMIVMSANCAQIAGAQIFRSNDAPRYHRAFIAVSVLAGAAWLLAAAQGAQYFLNRKKTSAPVVSEEATEKV